MAGSIDTERKECESTIHDDDVDLCETMVGWVDVPDKVTSDVGVHFGVKSLPSTAAFLVVNNRWVATDEQLSWSQYDF